MLMMRAGDSSAATPVCCLTEAMLRAIDTPRVVIDMPARCLRYDAAGVMSRRAITLMLCCLFIHERAA